jgi:hypothetical protein
VKAAPLVLLILGLAILVLFGLAAVVTVLLMATSGGKIDPEEAGPFLGGFCCCSFSGLPIAIGGLVWWLMARQRAN